MSLGKTLYFRAAVLISVGGIASSMLQAGLTTSVSLSALPSPAKFGHPVTLTAVVTPATVSGTVTFYDGPNFLGVGKLSSGKATLSTIEIGAGNRKLTARYNGESLAAPGLSSVVPLNVFSKPGGSFQPEPVATRANGFDNLAIADVNGDGAPDVIGVAFPQVYINLGRGDGTFSTTTSYTLPAGPAAVPSIAIADLNEDGFADIVVPNTAGSVEILFGNGNGTFQVPVSIDVGLPVLFAAIADFNGDGTADIVLVTNDSHSASLVCLLGNGDGTFQSPITLSLGFPVSSVITGDFNGDNKVDVAVVNSAANLAAVLLGKGDGAFGNPLLSSAGDGGAIVTADFNGDGIADLATASTVILGKGDGTFSAPFVLSVSGYYARPYYPVVADFNGDGIPDVLTTMTNYSILSVGIGDGTFYPGVPLEGIGVGGPAIGTADVNGDGLVDVISYSGSWIEAGLGLDAAEMYLSSSASSVTTGQMVVLSVAADPATATGTVYLTDNANQIATASLVSGRASFSITPTGGAHPYSVVYTGNSTFPYATSNTIPVEVISPTSTKLVVSPSSALLGQPITLTATVTNGDAPVSFLDGSQVLVSSSFNQGPGVSSVTTDALGAGTHLIKAEYPGSSDTTPSSASASLTITTTPGGQLAPGQIYLTDTNPFHAVVGDFDQDGFQDIAYTASGGISRILMLYGRGDGTFDGPAGGASPPFVPGAIVLDPASITHYPGIVIADPTDHQVVRYTGDGRSGFDESASILVNGSPSALVVSDFNNDGVPEIAVTTSDTNLISIISEANNKVIGTVVAGIQPSAISATDLNGDGNTDLIVSNQGGGNISVFLGNGDNTFRPAANYATASGPVAQAVGDFNSDGKPDLAVANGGGASVTILLGVGDGTFRPGAALSLAFNPSNVLAGDFNGDGKLDLAVSGPGGVLLLTGNGDGTFGTPTLYSSVAGAGPLLAAPFGGDGRLDLAAVLPAAGSIDLLLNRISTSLSLGVPSAPIHFGAKALFTATINHAISGGSVAFYDGPMELGGGQVVSGMATLASSELSPGTHNITARFTGASGYSGSVSPAPKPVTVIVAPVNLLQPLAPNLYQYLAGAMISDFNNDGHADLFLTGYNGDNFLVLGNGDGSFQPPIQNGVLENTFPIAVDLNNDGKPDIVAATPTGLIGNLGYGDGTFNWMTVEIPNPGSFGTSNSYAASLGFGDFNQDGIPDLVALDKAQAVITVSLGIGDGNFQLPLTQAASSNIVGLAVGDFNGDGFADVAVTGVTPGSAVQIYLGRGDGSLRPGVPAGMASQPTLVATADLNGDGKGDLIFLDTGTSGVGVMLGNGDGTFQNAKMYPTGDGPVSLSIGDLNGDGHLDVAVANSYAKTVSLLTGTGDGTLQPALNLPLSASPCTAILSNFNNTSTTDLLTVTTDSSGNSQVEVFQSVPELFALAGTPQITGAGLPYLVNLSVAAAPGTPVTFTAPASGPSGTFPGGSLSAQIVSAANSVAIAPILTANLIPGSFTVTATAGPASVPFNLTSICGAIPGSLAIAYDQNAASTTIPIASAGNCSWSATTQSSWITLAGASGNGNGTISIALSANATGYERTGQIGINGSIISVTQWTTVQVFADVTPAEYFFDGVNLLKQKNITSGCATNMFCPEEQITRAQMAIFIVRAVMGGDNFTYSAEPYFTDVPAGAFGFQWIQKFRDLGITTGCAPNLFCPSNTLTRAEAAIFLIRARYGSGTIFDYPPAPYFTDVPATGFGFAWIQRLKHDLITSGCAPTLFCPDNPVTRGDMAIFVMRAAFNQLLPPGTPVISQIAPSILATGGAAGAYTVTFSNVDLNVGMPVINPVAGLAPQSALGSYSGNTAILILSADPSFPPQPISLWMTIGDEQVVLPNGLVIQ